MDGWMEWNGHHRWQRFRWFALAGFTVPDGTRYATAPTWRRCEANVEQRCCQWTGILNLGTAGGRWRSADRWLEPVEAGYAVHGPLRRFLPAADRIDRDGRRTGARAAASPSSGAIRSALPGPVIHDEAPSPTVIVVLATGSPARQLPPGLGLM